MSDTTPTNSDAMTIVSSPDAKDWRHELTCQRCDTTVAVTGDHLEADSFKVSGYHFAGTAVCETRCYVTCPKCDGLIFVPDGIDVPYLVAQAAAERYEARLAARADR